MKRRDVIKTAALVAAGAIVSPVLSTTRVKAQVASPQIVQFRCLGTGTGDRRWLNGLTANGGVELAPNAMPGYTGAMWQIVVPSGSFNGLFSLKCLGNVQGSRWLTVSSGRVILTSSNPGPQWSFDNNGVSNSARIQRIKFGSQFLDGRTGDGTLGLVASNNPNLSSVYSGTIWEWIDARPIVLTYSGAYPGGKPPPASFPSLAVPLFIALGFAVQNGDGIFASYDRTGTAWNQVFQAQGANNARFLISLGGSNNQWVDPPSGSVNSWVSKATSSISGLIDSYTAGKISGIDIDYEQQAGWSPADYPPPNSQFVNAIGQLIKNLKERYGAAFVVTITPFGDPREQSTGVPANAKVWTNWYLPLYRQYSQYIDWINLQAYASYPVQTYADVDAYYKWIAQNVTQTYSKLVLGFSNSFGPPALQSESNMEAELRTLYSSNSNGRIKGLFTWTAENDAPGYTPENFASNLFSSTPWLTYDGVSGAASTTNYNIYNQPGNIIQLK